MRSNRVTRTIRPWNTIRSSFLPSYLLASRLSTQRLAWGWKHDHLVEDDRLSRDLADRVPLDDGLLSLVARDAVVVIAEVGALHVPQKLLVVRDDDELEVGLLLPGPDDVVQRLGQRPDVVAVEVRGGLVQGDELRMFRERELSVERDG